MKDATDKSHRIGSLENTIKSYATDELKRNRRPNVKTPDLMKWNLIERATRVYEQERNPDIKVNSPHKKVATPLAGLGDFAESEIAKDGLLLAGFLRRPESLQFGGQLRFGCRTHCFLLGLRGGVC